MMAFAQDYTERKDITKKEVKKLREAINSGRSNGTDKAINVFDKLLKKISRFRGDISSKRIYPLSKKGIFKG